MTANDLFSAKDAKILSSIADHILLGQQVRGKPAGTSHDTGRLPQHKDFSVCVSIRQFVQNLLQAALVLLESSSPAIREADHRVRLFVDKLFLDFDIAHFFQLA